MSKKRERVFCYSCDLECTVSFSKEEDKQQVGFCPFCGEPIERDDGTFGDEDEGSDEEDDRWG